jgi:hypothetical protein
MIGIGCDVLVVIDGSCGRWRLLRRGNHRLWRAPAVPSPSRLQNVSRAGQRGA